MEGRMRAGRLAALAAVLASMTGAGIAGATPPVRVTDSAPATPIAVRSILNATGSPATVTSGADSADACKIQRPDGLWPPFYYDDYWNTYTHGGFNSDWVAHPRPVGTVKAVVLFVDFPDRPASAVTQVAPIDYRQPQPYWEFLKASVPWFSTASYGRFNLDVTPIYKWYRMPKASTEWRMDYRSNDPMRRLSHDGQGEYTAAAVAAA